MKLLRHLKPLLSGAPPKKGSEIAAKPRSKSLDAIDSIRLLGNIRGLFVIRVILFQRNPIQLSSPESCLARNGTRRGALSGALFALRPLPILPQGYSISRAGFRGAGREEP